MEEKETIGDKGRWKSDGVSLKYKKSKVGRKNNSFISIFLSSSLEVALFKFYLCNISLTFDI